ncbi:MAG: Uma2 family endonuclease [bacterium]
MSVPLLKRRFTVDEYFRMGQAGIFSEDDRVELIDGEIVEMTAIGTRHAECVNRLTKLLVTLAGEDAVVSVQNPVRLDGFSVPQPDLAVLRPRSYAAAHPGPEDVLVIIEVSDTSLGYDKEVKLPLYARSGVPEVWIVDLERATVVVCRAPSAEGYREIRQYGAGQRITIEALPRVSITTDGILV